MIFFIHELNTGLKNCKMIYRYCNVSTKNLSLKKTFLKNAMYIHQIKGTAKATKLLLLLLLSLLLLLLLLLLTLYLKLEKFT